MRAAADRRRLRRYLVFLGLMGVSALCPFLVWRAGVAYIAPETANPVFHLLSQGLAAWGVLRNRAWSIFVYGVLALYSTADIVFAFSEPTNTPALQVLGTLGLIATTAWGAVFVLPEMENEP